MECRHPTVCALRLLVAALFSLVIAASTSWAASPRDDLAARGLKFTPEAFLQRVDAGDLEAVKLYLAAGMDVNAVKPKSTEQRSALFYASQRRHIEVVKHLVAQGAAVDGKDGQDQTPLMAAAIADQAKMVELLASLGADVNARGAYGQTPLIFAASFGNVSTVRSLLKLKADPNVRDDMTGGTALDRASHQEVTKLLKAAGGKKASELR